MTKRWWQSTKGESNRLREVDLLKWVYYYIKTRELTNVLCWADRGNRGGLA